MSGRAVEVVGVPAGAAAPADAPPVPGSRAGRIRLDVEGLRAVAILLVVVFHGGFPWLPGGFIGVDVFFVISGFLITGLLISEAKRHGRIRLREFWARRARRLLPASTLTLVTIAVVSWLYADPITAAGTGKEIVAAAGFVANWWFAAQQADYFAADVAHSPVLHFWSLSVEEQYYLMWPPLLALILWAARRMGLATGRALAAACGVLVVVGLASLAYSVALTHSDPVGAHYGTLGRAWELAVGGLVAFAVAAGLRLPQGAARVLGYAGMAAVLVSAVTFSEASRFPGTAALWPVLGTALVILAGASGTGRGHVGRWLSAPIMVWIGGLSYSWYLWHWPFFMAAGALVDDAAAAAMILAAVTSLAVSALSLRFVENPIRYSKALAASPRRSLILGTGLITTGLLAGLLLRPAPLAATDTGIRPAPVMAAKDLTQAHADGCLAGYTTVEPAACSYGPSDAAETIVLFGDSHAIQWFPAVHEMAQSRQARLLVFGKLACSPFGTLLWAVRHDRVYTECLPWQDEVRAQLAALDPGAVVVVAGRHDYPVVGEDGARMDRDAGLAALAQGYARTVRDLGDMGHEVVALRDTPFTTGRGPAPCVAGNLQDPSVCDFPRPDWSSGTSWEEQTLAAADLPTPVLDMNDQICGATTCPAVVDDILRWRDNDHITATFAATLAPELGARLAVALAE